jgi:hypothetical protein
VNQCLYSLAVFVFSFRKEFWDLTQYERGTCGVRDSSIIVKKGLMFQLSHKIEKHGQRYLKGLSPLFPLKIDGKGPYQVKAITSLFFYVHTPLFRGGGLGLLFLLLICYFQIFLSHSFNFMQAFSILVILSPLISLLRTNLPLSFVIRLLCIFFSLFFVCLPSMCFFFSLERTKAFILGLITAQIECNFSCSFSVSCFFLESKECLLCSSFLLIL